MDLDAHSIPALVRRRRGDARGTRPALQACLYPQRTLYNAETPDCHFRRFTPDGKFLIAFNRSLSGLQVFRVGLQVFRVLTASACASQLCDGDGRQAATHKSGFWHFFAPAWAQTYAGFGTTLHRDVCLVTSNMRHVIVARLKRSETAAAAALGPARPNMLVSVKALEDVTLLVVDLHTGRLVDSREYPGDIIYLSGHHGVSLLDDRLSLLSLKHQCLRLLRVGRDGRLAHMLDVGWHTREDDAICEDTLAVREQRAVDELAAQREKRRAEGGGREGACVDESGQHVMAKRRRMAGDARADMQPAGSGRSPRTSSVQLTTRTGVPLPFILPRSAQAHMLRTPAPAAVADGPAAMSLQTFQRLSPHYRMLYARVLQQQQQQQQQMVRGDVAGEMDAVLLEPSLTMAPHGGLKQRLLGALFLRAQAAGPAAMQHFFRTFRAYETLVLWRAQFITCTTLLLRFVPLHVATSRTHASRSASGSGGGGVGGASASAVLANAFTLLAEYDVETTVFGRIWDTADAGVAREVERRMDVYRAPMAGWRVLPSVANDLVLREAFVAGQMAVGMARSGGPVQAARKAAMLLPFGPQGVQESWLLDPAVFRCNLRVRQTLEKMRPAGVAPVRFYDRRGGALRFVLAPSVGADGGVAAGGGAVLATSGGAAEMQGARDAGTAAAVAAAGHGAGKAGVTYLFHPFLPLVLSTRNDLGANSLPTSNIHFRGGGGGD
ncbi:hypothetical protein GGI15_004735 [Coemansia interrupta]|uniref:Uncharacterized protein n=1 Tax=Coemansia interrupta TaxID=1126814 RepID=A0A9W8H8E2_9FUNG|nr:hypothetical protein GGI15_004735 [Coemansia interrupta]